MKLLLLSNSTIKGEAYLGWPQEYLKNFIDGRKRMAFVPFAGVTFSHEEYTASVQQALGSNIEVIGLHSVDNKVELIESADCLAVGGGNTFHLLARMQEYNLLSVIRQKVRQGVPYIGWSAGSNVACPTIMTTNDMPVVQPKSFGALGLTEFQINAHYTEKLIEGHGGESRKQRLDEFLEVNREVSVIGLPEGKLLELDDNKWFLKGRPAEPTRLFRYAQQPVDLADGEINL